MKDKSVHIEITTSSILKVLLVIAIIWFAYIIRDILLIVFLALILASILEPSVNWLHRKKIPKGAAVIGMYAILILILSGIITVLVPPISQQFSQLSTNFSRAWDTLVSLLGPGSALPESVSAQFQDVTAFFESQLPRATGGIFSTVSGILGSIISFFIVLVITFYFLVEESGLKRMIRSIVPAQYQPYLYRLLIRIQNKLGLWIRGQLILSLIVFVMVYVGLLLLQVEYALVLALLAAVLEFIPYIGPLVAGFFAVFLTIFTSPFKALLIVVLYFVIQQVENHILVPKIMQKTIGLNPIISIIALLIGARIGGVVGIIIAIPVVTAVSVFIKDFVDTRNQEQESV